MHVIWRGRGATYDEAAAAAPEVAELTAPPTAEEAWPTMPPAEDELVAEDAPEVADEAPEVADEVALVAAEVAEVAELRQSGRGRS